MKTKGKKARKISTPRSREGKLAPRTQATPPLPRNKANPAGGGRLVSGWLADFDKRAKRAMVSLDAILAAIPVTEPAQMQTNARRYLYQIDPARLISTVSRLLAEVLGPASETFAEAVQVAYAAGTLEGRRVLLTLLDDTRDLTGALRELPYLRRVAFVQARVFEEMKGFVGETAARLGSVLIEQLAEGKAIRDVKKALVEEFRVSKSRAERIARTEIIGALRRGRIDEAAETAEQFDVEIGLMWFSALSPTTRQSHAALHGKVLTPDEVREFYAEDGNAINCKCSQVEVVLKDGKPIQGKLVEREAARRDSFLKKKDEEK